MDCPYCGAENPDGAESCNLCFRRFGEEPANPDPEQAIIAVREAAAKEEAQAVKLRAMMLSGAIAAVGGSAFFLVSMGIIAKFGMVVPRFLFLGRTTLTFNAGVFVLSVLLFGLISGAVFGNVREEPDKVLTRRLVAAAGSLGVWLVSLYFTIIRGNADTSGSVFAASIIPLFMAFPITAVALALADPFHDGRERATVNDRLVTGIAVGVACWIPAVLCLALVGWVFPMSPGTAGETISIAVKLTLITLSSAFLFGGLYWAGIARVLAPAAEQ